MSSNQLWQSFFERQIAGNIPYNSKFYVVDQPVQVGGGIKVQLVSPTEQQVEQARSAVKRKLHDIVKPVKRRKIVRRKKVQKGGKKRPIKKRKKLTKKRI